MASKNDYFSSNALQLLTNHIAGYEFQMYLPVSNVISLWINSEIFCIAINLPRGLTTIIIVNLKPGTLSVNVARIG